MVAIHQVLPVFAPRDAIGNHTVAIRDTLRGMGIASEIVAGEVMPGAGHGARTCRELEGWRRRPRALGGAGPTWLIYHASTGSSVAEWFANRPERKLIDYHNISPAELNAPWEPHFGVELEHGRRQLGELAGLTEWALADSAYNERELRGLGYARTAVVPILLDTATLAHDIDHAALARLEATRARDGGTDWLFVSRLLPHKAQHDVVKAFAVYRRVYEPSARLHLVGAVGSARYAEAVSDLVDDLGLADAVEITGSLPWGEVEARYRIADVYVALSDHEGFGVPLLEAMAHDVPIVTFDATAVTETVGDAGVVLHQKDPMTTAAAAHRVCTDAALREQLIAAGREQLASFDLPVSMGRLREVVSRIVTDAGASMPTS